MVSRFYPSLLTPYPSRIWYWLPCPFQPLALIFLSLCVGSGVWLFFLWAVRKGEFDDPEGPKYRMLDD